MKSPYLLAAGLLFFLSCTEKDEPENLPGPTSCFEVTPTGGVSIGEEISFTNCSQNAKVYLWDFGDGMTSDEASPTHLYKNEGTFTVQLTAANEQGSNTTSNQVTVTSAAGYFSFDGDTYPLTNGILAYISSTAKWHSIVLYSGFDTIRDNGDLRLAGIGHTAGLDIVSGKSKFDVTGSYTLDTADFDGTQAEIDSMQDLTVYNGFFAIAHDYDLENETPTANEFIGNYDQTEYQNWMMNVSKDGDEYTIDISFIVGGKAVEVYYKGKLFLYEE